jgi:hypothetical protein
MSCYKEPLYALTQSTYPSIYLPISPSPTLPSHQIHPSNNPPPPKPPTKCSSPSSPSPPPPPWPALQPPNTPSQTAPRRPQPCTRPAPAPRTRRAPRPRTPRRHRLRRSWAPLRPTWLVRPWGLLSLVVLRWYVFNCPLMRGVEFVLTACRCFKACKRQRAFFCLAGACEARLLGCRGR